MARTGQKWYRELKNFFSSGIFYILLGTGFLVSAYFQIGSAGSHPSFIFLLAILGVAIILYGTGTHAVGKGNTGTINIAIAGGAGVLAMVLGFGVVKFNKQIQEVFSYTKYYAIIELESDNPNIDLDDYIIHAERPDKQPLYLWKRNQTAQILVPVYNFDKSTELKIFTRRYAADRLNGSTFNQSFTLDWREKKYRSQETGNDAGSRGEIEPYGGIAEDVRFSIKDTLIVTSADETIERQDPDGAGAERVRISPQ